MASGKSLELSYIQPRKLMGEQYWVKKDRDRSLAGKKRIRARRAK